MIGRLFDRIPEAWAARWARRLNLAYVLFMAGYLIAWWVLGLKVIATRELNEGAAILASFGWAPVMFVWMIVQGITFHHDFKRSRERLANLDRVHAEIMEHAYKAHREIDDHRRQETGLPPADPPPAVH